MDDSVEQHWKIALPNAGEFQLNSKRWTELGFQGNNPCSDYRAGGLLSAEQLYRFAKRFPIAYAKSLEISNADKTQYVTYFISCKFNLI